MDEDDGAIDADAGAGEIRAFRDENSRIRTNVGKEMGRSGLCKRMEWVVSTPREREPHLPNRSKNNEGLDWRR